jgi:hypothetical protein
VFCTKRVAGVADDSAKLDIGSGTLRFSHSQSSDSRLL